MGRIHYTDGFTVGEQAETYYGLRIFELAACVPTLKHYVWSNLDYGLKKGGYRPEYHCGHYDGKGRIGDWLTTNPFTTRPDGFKWTVFTNGPYAEMLYGGNFLPKILDDGTRVFAAPLGKGHVPIITLPDLGYFARYIFVVVPRKRIVFPGYGSEAYPPDCERPDGG
jgi:hypothetical protein